MQREWLSTLRTIKLSTALVAAITILRIEVGLAIPPLGKVRKCAHGVGLLRAGLLLHLPGNVFDGHTLLQRVLNKILVVVTGLAKICCVVR